MPASSARPIRLWLTLAVVALSTLAAGCSALRLGYNQGPTLAYWWLDGYADFNDAQTPRVRAALAEWFGWQRRTQLPDYAELLARAGSEVRHDVTAEQVCHWVDEGRTRLTAAVEHALPAMATIALTLTPEQLQHIERRYAKANEDFADDYLQKTLEERHAESLKRTLERTDTIYGSFDNAQRARLTRGIEASPFDPELWMVERRARQQELLSTLRHLSADRPSAAEAQQALRRLVARFERSPSETWRRYEQRLLTYNCGLAAEVHNATNETQRRKAFERLQGWEGDLRALAAQPES